MIKLGTMAAYTQQSFLVGASVIIVILTMFLVRKVLKGKKDDNILLKDPEKKYEVQLIEKENLTKDTRRFRFALDHPEQRLGLPVGQHVHLIEHLNNNLVIRSYTPTTRDATTKGYFELVIKVYFKDTHPKFPEGGKMTQYLESLKIGDKIKIKGPSGRIQYIGNGKFEVRKDKKSEPVVHEFEKLGLIAGGSGITPMYQLMQAIASDPNDKTEVYLLFANQSEDDILLRKEIEQLAKEHSDKIKFWYTVDRASDDWQYSKGFIDDKMIGEHLPTADDKTGIFMCGPPPMVQFACLPNLEKLNHKQSNVFKY